MPIVNIYQFVYVCFSFPLESMGWIWHLLALVPDHCLSFTFVFGYSETLIDKTSHVLRAGVSYCNTCVYECM